MNHFLMIISTCMYSTIVNEIILRCDYKVKSNNRKNKCVLVVLLFPSPFISYPHSHKSIEAKTYCIWEDYNQKHKCKVKTGTHMRE